MSWLGSDTCNCSCTPNSNLNKPVRDIGQRRLVKDKPTSAPKPEPPVTPAKPADPNNYKMFL